MLQKFYLSSAGRSLSELSSKLWQGYQSNAPHWLKKLRSYGRRSKSVVSLLLRNAQLPSHTDMSHKLKNLSTVEILGIEFGFLVAGTILSALMGRYPLAVFCTTLMWVGAIGILLALLTSFRKMGFTGEYATVQEELAVRKEGMTYLLITVASSLMFFGAGALIELIMF